MTLKVRLLLGAAAPLVFSLPAVAQVTISTATTTPVQTATANAGAASDVTIASGGSITLTAEGSTGATVNSDNDIINNGAIAINNANNSVGVRLQTSRTGSYTGTGSIALLEDYTRPDSDTDGDLDGPLATGTNRVGILVEEGGTFTGDVRISRSNTGAAAAAAGSVTVEGNNSAGVSIRSNLNGSYVQQGSVVVTGSNSYGLDIRENVTGDVQITGGTTVRGENSVGARILGDVGGEFLIGGAITSTGFAQGDASNYEDPDQADDNDTGSDEPAKLDADDLLNNGSAVDIRGGLARGLLINGAAVGTTDPTDDVKDVIQDFNENRSTGTITALGSAPALNIQAQDGAGGSILLSRVRETILDTLDDDDDDNFSEVIGVFNYDHALINRGVVTANGVNMGFSATGIRIAGSADGTNTTTIEGGILNSGTIQARAFEANAIGLNIGAGAITPTIRNTSTIRADVNTETTHDSYGIRIDAGANVTSVVNDGLLLASVRGYDGDAYAFQDLSGTVTSFTNSSRITAGFVDDDTTDDITSGNGLSIAIDLSNNTTGVVVTQNDIVDNARINGNVLTGSGNDRFDILSGEVFGAVDFGTGSDTLNVNSALLNGSATFNGTGATVSANGGDVIGAIALGNASGSLSFVNGSEFFGDITRATGAAGPLSLTVDNSGFTNFADGTLNLTSMTLANNTQVGLAINNARVTGNVPMFNVAGTASIAANTRFTPVFDQFTNQSFTLRLLDATTLTLGGSVADMLNENGPFLYNMDLVQPNANAIDLVLSVKTASELGLNTRQAGAYGAVLDLLEEDDEIGAAVTSLANAADFQRGWADLLPSNDASVMRVLASNASAAFGATANRLDMISQKPDAPGGAWTEEFGVYHNADATSDSVGISGGGFGVAAGIDVLSTGSALVGAYLSLESAELEEDGRTAAPLNVSQTSVGAYGGWINGNLALNGTASVGFIDFTSERDVELGSLSDTLRGSWKGQSYSASGRATYKVPLGWLDVKPFVGADYIGFTQDGYTETALTTDGLAIIAGDSDASLTTASAGLQLIGNLGGDDAYSLRPELSVGYRSVLNWDSTAASMRFAGGPTGSNFSLAPGVEPEDAIVAGLGFSVDSQFLNIKLGYDAEIADSSMTHYGSITLRMAFW